MFEIPKYSTKLYWLGDMKSNGIDPDPTIEDLERMIKKNGIESIAIEMHPNLLTHENTLICHVERVVASTEE